jgi:hypothetical protein
MTEETQRIWDALKQLYGQNLQAATVVVLVKTSDTTVKVITTTIPQVEEDKHDKR